MSRRRWLSSALVLVVGMGLVVAGDPIALAEPAASVAGVAIGGAGGDQPDGLSLTSVSNTHPNYVSGGQVLLRVTAPDRDGGSVLVTLNGRPVTADFRRQADGTLLTLLGLVSGLRIGRNLVEAVAGRDRTSLTVDNHPITGPVFSGPQQTPFYCETTAFGLAPAIAAAVLRADRWSATSTRPPPGAFVAAGRPGVAAGRSGHRNGGRPHRALHRPGRDRHHRPRRLPDRGAVRRDRAHRRTAPDRSWNGKLVYTFGGGCNGGFHQGASTGGVLNDLFLSQGYAVASSSLNVLDNNCSTIISAEAAMMVKEHFIETYGPVQHTIGWGGSGGAIQQYDIAEMYPGILDGIVPGVSFPDPLTVLAARSPTAGC